MARALNMGLDTPENQALPDTTVILEILPVTI